MAGICFSSRRSAGESSSQEGRLAGIAPSHQLHTPPTALAAGKSPSVEESASRRASHVDGKRALLSFAGSRNHRTTPVNGTATTLPSGSLPGSDDALGTTDVTTSAEAADRSWSPTS